MNLSISLSTITSREVLNLSLERLRNLEIALCRRSSSPKLNSAVKSIKVSLWLSWLNFSSTVQKASLLKRFTKVVQDSTWGFQDLAFSDRVFTLQIPRTTQTLTAIRIRMDKSKCSCVSCWWEKPANWCKTTKHSDCPQRSHGNPKDLTVSWTCEIDIQSFTKTADNTLHT